MSQVAKLTVAEGNVKLLSKSGATVATHAVKNVDKIELKGSTAGMVQLTKQSPSPCAPTDTPSRLRA